MKRTVEPGEIGSGLVLESKIVGGSVPKEYIPGVEKGIQSVAENGVLAGLPLIDFKVTLTDGAVHDVDLYRIHISEPTRQAESTYGVFGL